MFIKNNIKAEKLSQTYPAPINKPKTANGGNKAIAIITPTTVDEMLDIVDKLPAIPADKAITILQKSKVILECICGLSKDTGR